MRKVSFTDEEKKFLLDETAVWKRDVLNNCREFSQYPDSKLLLAGVQYPGIWLEHNQDNMFLAEYAPGIAWASCDAFMRFQREDGMLPFCLPLVWKEPGGFFYPEPACFWQIQSVLPFARSAFFLARKTGRGKEDFERIYKASAAYDEFLGNFRDHKELGLVEMYCEYDTGHDNDPRVKDGGIPESCPGKNAVNMPDLDFMPVLSVDLSAMRYGGRIALADIAEYLGWAGKAEMWRHKAATTRLAIKKYFYDPETEFYYDRDKNGLRKYKTEHITRLFLNQVLTQEEFDRVYTRYFSVPGKEFCPDWPIPSVSVNDPCFDHNCPQNSWGSNSQANTVLRTPLWMDYYNRSEDLTDLAAIWLRAYCDHPEDGCRQELNPFTGRFVKGGNGKDRYSPTLLFMLWAVKRMGWQ